MEAKGNVCSGIDATGGAFNIHRQRLLPNIQLLRIPEVTRRIHSLLEEEDTQLKFNWFTSSYLTLFRHLLEPPLSPLLDNDDLLDIPQLRTWPWREGIACCSMFNLAFTWILGYGMDIEVNDKRANSPKKRNCKVLRKEVHEQCPTFRSARNAAIKLVDKTVE
jgi:hypothetical protein